MFLIGCILHWGHKAHKIHYKSKMKKGLYNCWVGGQSEISLGCATVLQNWTLCSEAHSSCLSFVVHWYMWVKIINRSVLSGQGLNAGVRLEITVEIGSKMNILRRSVAWHTEQCFTVYQLDYTPWDCIGLFSFSKCKKHLTMPLRELLVPAVSFFSFVITELCYWNGAYPSGV